MKINACLLILYTVSDKKVRERQHNIMHDKQFHLSATSTTKKAFQPKSPPFTNLDLVRQVHIFKICQTSQTQHVSHDSAIHTLLSIAPACRTQKPHHCLQHYPNLRYLSLLPAMGISIYRLLSYFIVFFFGGIFYHGHSFNALTYELLLHCRTTVAPPCLIPSLTSFFALLHMAIFSSQVPWQFKR